MWSCRDAHDAQAAELPAPQAEARTRLPIFTCSPYRRLWGAPHNRRYLIWKVREAEKGRVPVGPRETRTASQEAVTDMRILPLRLDAPRVAALDATWRAKGMKSRMDLFRRALAHYLAHVGAHGAAALFEAS
jgi:hypothetical protein